MGKIDVKSVAMVFLAVLICSTITSAEPQNNDSNTATLSQTISKPADSNEINCFVAALGDKDASVRLSAVQALVDIGKPAVEPLIVALKGGRFSDSAVAAAIALGQIGDSRAVEPLIAELRYDVSSVADEAQKALVKIGDPAVEHLIAALRDENWRIRRQAVEALGMIGDKRAAEPLIAELKDKSDYLFRTTSEEAIMKIGRSPVEPLIAALNNKNESSGVRSGAAEILGRLRESSAVEPLIAALKDEDWEIRQQAAQALGMIGDKRAIEPLIATLKDITGPVREKSAGSLGKIGDARAVECLIATLNDTNYDVRRAAAEALEMIGDARAITPLIAILEDDGPACWAAMRALTKIGEPAVEPLIAALKAWNANTREHAARALGAIKDKHAVEPLITALKDKKADVGREAAAEALGNIGDARAVKPLIVALSDEKRDVRMSAAKALGELGDQRAVPYLILGLKDSHWYDQAAKTLQKFGWQPQTIEDKVHYYVAIRDKQKLTEMWMQTKDVLLKDLLSKKDRVARNAFYAFFALGEEEVIPELINMLHSKGDKAMAEMYLNCGESRLRSAAETWATRHGYAITASAEQHGIRWGSW